MFLQNGDSIYVDAGTYTEQLTITTGIILQGAGTDQTIIQSPNSASSGRLPEGVGRHLKDQGSDACRIIGVKSDQ